MAHRHRVRRRQRPWLVGGCVLIVILLVPLGYYDPYPRTLLAESQTVRACRALPISSVNDEVGEKARASTRLAPKPNVTVEDLFPTVSINECDYSWHAVCAGGNSLRSLSLAVIDLPNNRQASSRYSYDETALDIDSLNTNHFREFSFRGRQAYEVSIGNEVLMRVLDSHFVVDMHYYLCAPTAANDEQAAIWPLALQLRLPISQFVVSRSRR